MKAIRKGTRVFDHERKQVGRVLSFVHWDRTYYRIRFDDGTEGTSEHVTREDGRERAAERSES